MRLPGSIGPGLRTYAEAAARKRAAERRRRRPRSSFVRILALVGPGLIAANAGNDAGAIATHSSAGASYGYSLLWVMVATSLPLIIIQEMCARMGAVTGKGLADLIRERFGVRWTTFAMLILLVANAGTVVSEFAGIAAALELFDVSRYFSVPVAAFAIWWLLARGSYRHVERVFLGMTAVFFAYVLAAFLAQPNWGEVAIAAVTPTFRFEAGYLSLVVALVGTTITPYMQLFIQSSVVDKGIDATHYRAERAEVVFGSLFANLVVMFIQIATAATLFIAGIRVDAADDAARALAPVAGPFASVLFGLGLFGASMLAAGVLPLATAFAVCEAFGFERGLSRDFDEAPVFYVLFTAMIVAGAVVTLIPGLSLIQLLIAVQVANGLLLPVVLVFVTRLAGDRELLGTWANGPILSFFAWSTAVVVGLLALTYVTVVVVMPIFGMSIV